MFLKRSYAAILAVLLSAGIVPAAKAATLRVGSDISYAPVEFYQGHAHRVAGLDFDLAQELAKHLGDSLSFTNHDFNGIVPALQAGTFDIVMSAMSDTRQREKQIDFVDYFLAGSGILVPKGNPDHIFGLGDLCGRTVDLQKGSSQEALLKAQSAKCEDVKLGPITILSFRTDEDAFKQIVSRKSVAHISDYPVVAYLAQTFEGGKRFDVVGHQFGVVPYGIAIPKNNHVMRDAVQAALLRMIADGSYDRILKKWHLEQGAFRSAPISAGTLF
ncbi:MAG: ABC transporter substrate-binding protein [Candidatus Eremiobacteraeota bacterium]|nr:ABC transporter substrate-binding protein [Candidatus Eremiobacteraeota bacterium]